MDLDGDEHDDIISGSYWPGDLFVFRGTGNGAYAKREEIKDSTGKNLNAGTPWKTEDKPEMDSLASAPFAFDIDGDGDLDMLVGNIAGRVILIPNEGSRRKPAFDTVRRRALEADGQPIRVPGGDSGPVVADWDHDGRPDLLVGAGDGSVWFYRNAGTAAAPKYAKGETVLPKSSSGYENATPAGTAPTGPGTRTKLCAFDWNGDGLLDLLVGDVWYEKPADLKLSPEDVKKRDELRKRYDELSSRYSQRREVEKAAKDDPELLKIAKEIGPASAELAKYEARTKARGSVWLYLRQSTPERK